MVLPWQSVNSSFVVVEVGSFPIRPCHSSLLTNKRIKMQPRVRSSSFANQKRLGFLQSRHRFTRELILSPLSWTPEPKFRPLQHHHLENDPHQHSQATTRPKSQVVRVADAHPRVKDRPIAPAFLATVVSENIWMIIMANAVGSVH